MIFALAVFVFLLGASAATIPRQSPSCGCFNLIGSGLPSGPSPVVENTIGENELGSIFQRGQFCFSQAQLFGLVDGLGNNCIILDSSKQFQCVSGMQTQTKFTIDDHGNLLTDGCSDFLACPTIRTGGGGAYDIFSSSLANITDCVPITMQVSNFMPCTAMGRPPSTTADISSTISASTTTVTVTSITQSNAVSVSPFEVEASPSPTATLTSSNTVTCPTDISSGLFLPPNLIVPVSPETPDVTYGTSYSGTITPQNTTLFAFDIPWSYPYTCALILTFPYVTDSQFPYKYSGLEEEFGEGGGIVFGELEGLITSSTAYKSMDPVHYNYGRIQVVPGNNYMVGTFRCPTGNQLAISAASVGNFVLEFFQSTGASPMGLWVVPCQ